jgi:hypothetical protein
MTPSPARRAGHREMSAARHPTTHRSRQQPPANPIDNQPFFIETRSARGSERSGRVGASPDGYSGSPRFNRRRTRAFSARIARCSRSVRQSGQITPTTSPSEQGSPAATPVPDSASSAAGGPACPHPRLGPRQAIRAHDRGKLAVVAQQQIPREGFRRVQLRCCPPTPRAVAKASHRLGPFLQRTQGCSALSDRTRLFDV